VFAEQPLLIDLYASTGLDTLVGDPTTLNAIIGLLEIGLGLLVLTRPSIGVLTLVVAWKLGTEGLYLTGGANGAGWEVIERAGAYAAPLAVICLNSIARQRPSVMTPSAPSPALRA